MTKHAVLSASSSDRWISCPGSIRLSEGMPKTTSVYAQEGTAAHALAERCLRKGLDPDVWVGADIEGVEVTEEMCEAVQVYVDYVRAQMVHSGVKMYLETKFDLAALKPPVPMWGTSDCVIWNEAERHMEVVDYKHGQGYAVRAVGNPQLRYYALGAILKLRVKPAQVTVTIVQPRASHPDGIIRSETITWEELVAWKKDVLMPAAARTLDDDAPIQAGGHCTFCPALAVCPSHHQLAVETAQNEFTAEGAAELPVPQALTPEQVLKVLDVSDRLYAWLNAVRDFARGELEAGRPVPGWKLVAKRATRKWTDENEVVRWLGEETDLADSEIYSRKLLSPAQIEKVLKKAKVALPEELVIKASSGFNLARESDRRPALAGVSAADEFEAAP